MQGLGRPDIVNAGSRETRYSECRVQGDQIGYSECRVRGRPDIVDAGSGEIVHADIVNAGSGGPDIVNAGSGGTGYSECRVRGDRI
ncbi:unnamed protein product [Staurois parvus]|uniref:Right-handed parallel beta-helix repeat-containing protein n=1 Tax=Staurois parvus TaxID=386267 RepID=A0ABN9E9T3_9NEOB|nr:unnamed protein product [Staurois parvus]